MPFLCKIWGCCRSTPVKKSKNCLQFCVRSHHVMNEPDSKLPKLCESDEIKSKHVQLFDQHATTFESLVKMEAFVDHTNLIKCILWEPSLKFVVAPSRFCKTTNISMARCFLEIEVHREGEKEGEAVRDVMREATSVDELKGPNLKNYDLFCVPEPKCKILGDEEFVLKHFGRYPVIKLDFAVEEITSFNDALNHCLLVIHKAYVDHTYLQKSTRLDKGDALDLFKKWCSTTRYDEGDVNTKMDNVKTGLLNLARFLHSHFGRKVVLLVDECDAIVSRAKFGVKTDEELSDISSLVIEMLGDLLKGNASEKHVKNALLTGVEIISALASSRHLAGVVKYMFLHREEFVGFYGERENDVRDLVTKLKSKELLPLFENKDVGQIMEEIMKHCNGYYSLGCQSISILSLWSVLHYLQDGKAKVHCTKPQVMTHIKPLLKHLRIVVKILQLLGKRAGEETVLVNNLYGVDISQLRRLGKQDATQQPNFNLSFTYLRELGYLSNVKDSDERRESVNLKLANEEIRRELLELLVESSVKILGFDFSIMQQVANMFDDILSPRNVTDETCHEHLRNFFVTLKTLFTQAFSQFGTVYISDEVLKSLMVIALSKVGSLEWIASDHPEDDSEGKYLTPGRSGVDIWMRHKKNNSFVIFELKYIRWNYSSTEEQKLTSLYALKEILGKEGGKKGCVSALNDLKPLKYLLIGLSIDSNFQPSISCLLNTEDDKKTICLSETELTKFPVYYEGCVDLLKE